MKQTLAWPLYKDDTQIHEERICFGDPFILILALAYFNYTTL